MKARALKFGETKHGWTRRCSIKSQPVGGSSAEDVMRHAVSALQSPQSSRASILRRTLILKFKFVKRFSFQTQFLILIHTCHLKNIDTQNE